jgi:D-3-phosphoglycerate dehydrogenase / 2-oxoglutarate reductase
LLTHKTFFEHPFSILHSPFSISTLQLKTKADMTTPAQEIPLSPNRLARAVSHSLSVSPTATFHSPPSSFGGPLLTRTTTAPKQLKPFDTQDIKILLLENINQSGRDILKAQGYQVEALKTSLPEHELIEKIR